MPDNPYAGFGPQANAAVDPYAGFGNATPKAVGSVLDDPARAGKSIELSNTLKQPPTVIYHDFDSSQQENKAKQTSTIVDTNPHIQNYVNNVPLAASVSNDDWPALSRISEAIVNLLPDYQAKRAEGAAILKVPEVNLTIQTAAGRQNLQDIVASKALTTAQKQDILFSAAVKYSPIDVGMSLVSRMYGKGVEAITGIPAEEAEKSLMVLRGAAPGQKPLGKFVKDLFPGKTPAMTVDEFLTKTRGMRTRGEIDDFLTRRARGEVYDEKTGTWSTPEGAGEAAQKLLSVERANTAAADLKEVVAQAAETQTRPRSATVFEQFVDSHGDTGKLHISAARMLELYEAEGKVPMPGDGLFGFIPGLTDKMTLAAEAGGEIAVPISKYVANIDPAVHEKVADVVRVHEKGTTLEEAKEISKEIEAGPEVFHGSPHEFTAFDITKLGTGEGAQSYGVGHYVAEEPAVAKDYAKPQNKADTATIPNLERAVKNTETQIEQAKASNVPKEVLAELEMELIGRQNDLKLAKGESYFYRARILRKKEEFLDWDKPLKEQSDALLQKLAEVSDKELSGAMHSPETTAKQLKLMKDLPTPLGEWLDAAGGGSHGYVWSKKEDMSKALSEAGIAGIKYLDQQSRPAVTPGLGKPDAAYAERMIESLTEQLVAAKTEAEKAKLVGYLEDWQKQLETFKKHPEGTSNYVVFRDEDLLITHRNEQPITPETLTAVTAVEKEAKSLGITSPIELFTAKFVADAQALGVTNTMLKDYANLIDRRQEAILTKSVAVAEREVKKRQTAQWSKDEAEMATEVETDLRSRPDLAADRFLRDGDLPTGERVAKVKFNKAEVEAVAGEGALPRYVTDGEGANIGLVANTFGFDTGPELILALDNLAKARKAVDKGPKAYLNQLVKDEVAKRMEEKYGDLKTNIAVEASSIALQDYNVDLLSAQWKMLAKMAGVDPPITRSNLTAWAHEQFGMAEVGQVSYEGFRRTTEKAGLAAEKALLKGKYNEAFQAKQTQMLNFLLAKEAKAFETKVVKPNERLIDRYAGVETLPNVEQVYTDQIHASLYSYGVGLARTRESIDYNLKGVTLSDFIDVRNRNGALMPKPPLPTSGKTTLDDFTVNEYTDYANLLHSLDYNGKLEKSIEVAGKKEDLFQMVDRTAKNLDALEKKGFNPDVKGPISALRKAGRYVDAKLLKAEKLIDWIDHEDPLGPMNSILRGLIEGEHKKGSMTTRLAKKIAEMPTDRAWGKKLNELANNQELLDWETGEPIKVTNEQKIVMALNYGNMGNRNVMLRAHHWTEGEMEAFLGRTMTEMDWKAVDSIHDLFKDLAPLVEETTRKRSGLAVPLVEPTPFLKSKGGYFPLIQDPRSVLIGAKTSTDLFDKTKFDPLPMAPALKQRTGAVYPLDFSLNRINSVLSQTIHAVYLQEPVINANKLITDPIIREGIAKAFGPEYITMLDVWIRDIANNGGMNDDAIGAWVSRNVRENVVVQLMGYKVSTALIHGGSAAAASMYEMGKMHLEEKGPKSFVLAPVELIKNIKALGLDQFLPEEARRFFANSQNTVSKYGEVISKSLELQNRQRALQKDFGYQLDKIVNKNVWDDAVQVRAVYHAYAMSMVGYLDLLTATPVWLAAEAKALHDGYEPADAIFIADKAVREAHGSASLISRANIGRGEINKWMTIAYNGYWNHNYNKSREVSNIMTGRSGGAPPQPPPGFSSMDAGIPDPDPRFTAGMKTALGAGFLTAMMIAGAVVHHAVRGDEEESVLGPGSLLSQMAGQIPIINTLFYALMHSRDPQLSPIEEVLKSGTSTAKDAASAVGMGLNLLGFDFNVKAPKRPVAHASKFLGFTTGVGPTNQLIDLMTFLEDVVNEDQVPEGVGEWFNGLMTGSIKKKKGRR